VAEPVALKYRAFISYSHRDKKWCEWLHRSLEGFRIGKDLVGRQTPAGKIPPTLRPIFRDREDFSAGHSLAEQSIAALEASQFLIVLCSSNAARSQYVNEEIRYFKSLGRADRVIPLIIAGEPGDAQEECFPTAMRFKVGPDGALTDEREEPIAADARPQGDGKNIALSKLVAGLLGIGFDEVVRRAERARKRRNRIWGAVAGAIVFLAVSASGTAVYAYTKLIESEENLDHAVTFAYGFVSEATAQADRYGVSVETTLRLLRRAESALEGLMAAGRSTPGLRYRHAVMLLSFADNYFKLGQSAEALRRAEEARVQLNELTEQPIAARRPWQLDLARAHIQIGNVKIEQGISSEAVASYRQALATLEQLTASDPGRRDWQLALARAHERIGNGLSDQGASKDALAQYRDASISPGRWSAPILQTPTPTPCSPSPISASATS
jgi:tetratricopeptide (TPR) repeat protein